MYVMGTLGKGERDACRTPQRHVLWSALADHMDAQCESSSHCNFQHSLMSYETISVRMNRSDTSIRWGFTLGQHGNKIVVATVDRESLSDKAGMKPGDEVDSICGRDAHNMSINDANSIVFTAHQEIHFNLRRYVTTHTCLPWTLTEKDNKLFVDEVQPGFGTGFGTGSEDEYRSSSANYKSLDSSNQQRSIPIQYQPSYQSNFSSHNSTRGTHNGSYVVNNSQPRVYHSPSTYSRHAQSDHTKTTTQGATVQGTSNIQPHSVSSTQNFTSVPSDNNVNHSIATVGNSSNLSSMYNMKHASEQYSTSDNAPPAAQNYSYNNGVTTTAYKPSSGGIPLNQTAFIQTSQHSPLQYSSAVSPRGTRVYYHSPSDRTRRSLSPHASVQHLQYNTPVNLYSTESAAEQYKMQTGRPIELPASATTQPPAYLTSEVKKLIEEQEHGRGHRVASPSTQSSSFKRISQAVGEPVN